MAKGKKTGGRKPGSQNKLTKSFKEILKATVDQMEDNPSTNLLSFAQKHPKEFWQIAAKLMPLELSGTITQRTVKVIRE